jgi:hypothetical protein
LLDDFGGAAAAYSLRALSRGWVAGDVVEVRRSSDSTSQDFTASQITGGQMLSFVNNDTTSLYNSARYFNGGSAIVDITSTVSLAGDFTITLDWIKESKGGAGTQYLLTDSGTSADRFGFQESSGNFFINTSGSSVFFTGVSPEAGVSSIELSRVGTDVTLTIGASSDTITSSGTFDINEIGFSSKGSISNVNINSVVAYTGLGTSVTAWEDTIGSNDGTETNGAAYTGQPFDGFVSTWYDQSGNANNATQGTTTAQPKIVDAGALVVGGLDFDGVDDFFDLGDLALTQPNSVFFVHNSDNQGGGSDVLNDFLDHNGTGGRTLIDSSGGLYRAFAGASDASTKIIVAGADALVSTTINGASSELALNGSNETGLSVGTGGMGEMTLGKSLGGVYDGTFAEFIIYATNQSANRVAIETNINAAYTIF